MNGVPTTLVVEATLGMVDSSLGGLEADARPFLISSADESTFSPLDVSVSFKAGGELSGLTITACKRRSIQPSFSSWVALSDQVASPPGGVTPLKQQQDASMGKEMNLCGHSAMSPSCTISMFP